MPLYIRAVFLVLVACMLLPGQQDITAEWKLSLNDLERRLASDVGETWRADEEALRSSLAAFAAAHPEMNLRVPNPLAEQFTADSLRQQVSQLAAAVNEVVKNTPGSPFNLGRVEVDVTARSGAVAPVADSLDQSEIRNLNLTNAAKALDYLPGVSIQHIATNRNEAGIMLRGFSTRGQVPLYLDGIPISVPYDGYVDFNRFLTSDLAEVQVARGYSSPLMGPNALGGTINLVTQEPDAKAQRRCADRDRFRAIRCLLLLRLGTRWRRYFVQASEDWLQASFLPLAGSFPVLSVHGAPPHHNDGSSV